MHSVVVDEDAFTELYCALVRAVLFSQVAFYICAILGMCRSGGSSSRCRQLQ